MTGASEPLILAPPLPRHPRLQRFYLFLAVSVFASVVYFSSVKPHTAPDLLQQVAHLNDQDDDYKVTQPSSSPRPPNLILVLTDDQDSVLLGASHMPQTRQLLAARGAVLPNAFVSSPLCCPSRASILTGRYVHNHGTRNNSLEGHCSDGHWQGGPEKQSLATHLHSAGYQTFFAGKYLNQYGKAEAGGLSHVPPGWDSWFGLQGNSRYYNYTLSANGEAEWHGSDPNKDYLTKVIWLRAKEFLDTVAPVNREESVENDSDEAHNDSNDESNQSTQPFFMMLSTPAAHAPFTPESKYAKDFADLEAPRTKNFNVRNDDTKHWLLRLGPQPLSDDIINKVDVVFRDRLRTLLTVDDMVADIIAGLEENGLLDNTYILFTSDNGYHLGQFSLPIDKREPYEFDIRVPLMVRGPGITEGTVIPYATVNVDLAPTLLDLAGVVVPNFMDGVSLKPLLLGNSESVQSEVHVDRHSSHLNYSKTTAMENDSSPQNFTQFSSEKRLGISLQTKTESSYHTADVFARRSILVEHSGEGYQEQASGCEGLGSGLYGCSVDYDCKCSDSSNNTYACVRQLFVAITVESTFDADQSLFSNDDEKEGRREDQQRDHYDIEPDHPRRRLLRSGSSLLPDPEYNTNRGVHVYQLGNADDASKVQHSDALVTFNDTDQCARSKVRPIKDIIYCEWDDNERFVEYYDLSKDIDQLHNGAGELSSETLAEYKTLLANLRKCQGQSCRAV